MSITHITYCIIKTLLVRGLLLKGNSNTIYVLSTKSLPLHSISVIILNKLEKCSTFKRLFEKYFLTFLRTSCKYFSCVYFKSKIFIIKSVERFKFVVISLLFF